MRKRYCPTQKSKHFNEAWAKIAAQEIEDKFGGYYRVYHCPGCRWWHVYDRTKRTRKQEKNRSRSSRRRRSKKAKRVEK